MFPSHILSPNPCAQLLTLTMNANLRLPFGTVRGWLGGYVSVSCYQHFKKKSHYPLASRRFNYTKQLFRFVFFANIRNAVVG
jgi:hypothetical protein